VLNARSWGGQETEDGEVIVGEELKRLGGDEKEWPQRRKGDPQKVKLAVVSDGSHLNRRETDLFPFDPRTATKFSDGFVKLGKYRLGRDAETEEE
jgi:hypothetical protein